MATFSDLYNLHDHRAVGDLPPERGRTTAELWRDLARAENAIGNGAEYMHLQHEDLMNARAAIAAEILRAGQDAWHIVQGDDIW